MNKRTQAKQSQKEEETVLVVQKWLDTFVLGMNLCPFAKSEMLNKRVRLISTNVMREEQLLLVLQDELELLNCDSSIETTLLIHANVLQNFYDYNQFLTDADNLLLKTGLEGIYQIASFHPDYQFDGTKPQDAANYTNRSPYPLLHLIREASLERVIAEYPEVDEIPAQNIALMNSLGNNKLKTLFASLFKP